MNQSAFLMLFTSLLQQNPFAQKSSPMTIINANMVKIDQANPVTPGGKIIKIFPEARYGIHNKQPDIKFLELLGEDSPKKSLLRLPATKEALDLKLPQDSFLKLLADNDVSISAGGWKFAPGLDELAKVESGVENKVFATRDQPNPYLADMFLLTSGNAEVMKEPLKALKKSGSESDFAAKVYALLNTKVPFEIVISPPGQRPIYSRGYFLVYSNASDPEPAQSGFIWKMIEGEDGNEKIMVFSLLHLQKNEDGTGATIRVSEACFNRWMVAEHNEYKSLQCVAAEGENADSCTKSREHNTNVVELKVVKPGIEDNLETPTNFATFEDLIEDMPKSLIVTARAQRNFKVAPLVQGTRLVLAKSKGSLCELEELGDITLLPPSANAKAPVALPPTPPAAKRK